MTTLPLLSPLWYRVAYLKPRLKAGVRVARQTVRGRTWYVLTDAVSGRHHRFDARAYTLVAACNGDATIDEVWARRVDADGDAAPTQAEAIDIFAKAFAANLLGGDTAADARATLRARRKRDAVTRRAALNPLSFKLPLWNPSTFLDANAKRVAWLFSTTCLRVLLVAMLAGVALFAAHAGDFAREASHQLGQGRMLILLWLAYPLIKLVHELAHAFAVKVYGGAVHEMGISLLLLTPVPYVDASACAAFENKRERAIVGAAGIAAEWCIASVALLLWTLAEPGLVRDVAFSVAVVGGVSTLVVNANPLLRFDGYHVLCDMFELPNLASRSSGWWHARLAGWATGRASETAERVRGSERVWLAFYAPASWICRGSLTVGLAFALADWNAWLGLALLALALWWLIGSPAYAALRWFANSADLHGARLRTTGIGAATIAAAVAFVCFAPLPDRTIAPGVVWLPDEALVRPGVDGFVEQVLVNDGDHVAAGTPLVRLSNDALRHALRKAEAELQERRVEQRSLQLTDPLRAAQAGDRVDALAAEAQRLADRVAALDVRAGVAGRVAIDTRRLVAGRWLAQGQTAAHVLPPGAPIVRALIAHDDIAQVRDQPGTIDVALSHDAGAPLAAQWLRGVPRATTQLVTPALGTKHGGPIAVDHADAEGRTALEPRFEVELRLPADAHAHVGARAWVSFHHADATLATLSARLVRRTFLRHFAA